MLEVILTAENDGDIVNEPFPVHSHEFVSEGIRLDIVSQLPCIVRSVQTVHGTNIYFCAASNSDFPELEFLCENCKYVST